MKQIFDAAGIVKSIRDELDGGPKGNIDPDQEYVCPTCNKYFQASDTAEHNSDLGRDSGPFKRKENEP